MRNFCLFEKTIQLNGKNRTDKVWSKLRNLRKEANKNFEGKFCFREKKAKTNFFATKVVCRFVLFFRCLRFWDDQKITKSKQFFSAPKISHKYNWLPKRLNSNSSRRKKKKDFLTNKKFGKKLMLSNEEAKSGGPDTLFCQQLFEACYQTILLPKILYFLCGDN